MPGIFRTLIYLKPDTCSEPSQRFKMKCLTKIVKGYKYFSKHYVRFCQGSEYAFPPISTHKLVELRYTMYCIRYTQKLVYYHKFRHIQAYSHPILAYSVILWYIQNHIYFLLVQNPVIFRTQDIFRTLSRHILAYSQCCVTLTYFETLLYSELCHIQHFDIFKTQSISRILFIQTYSGIFNNDGSIDTNFVFFYVNLLRLFQIITHQVQLKSVTN